MSMLGKLKEFKDMRDKAKVLQDMLSGESATGTKDGVAVTVDGTFMITGIAIDDTLLAPAQKDKLQKAIKDAHKDAMGTLQRTLAAKMKDMPGMPSL
jgi:DNA-binding protein YbaB